MKKLIALGAVLVLLFSFTKPITVVAAPEDEEVEFGSGLPIPDYPFE